MEKLQKLIAEPPPDHVFEITGHGLAQAQPRSPSQPRLELFPERAVVASPSAPNLVKPQYVREALARIGGQNAGRAATMCLVVPDYAARMSVLDFQQFPDAPAERSALLRFRLRKSVPFHIEEAQLAHAVQVQEPQRIEVLAVAIARPIVEEYEQIFLEHGYRVGLVTPSSMAAFPLFSAAAADLTLAIKAAGETVSVFLIENGNVRLVRSLDLALGEDASPARYAESVLALMQQTVAYGEDQLGARVSRILLCGFDGETELMIALSEQEFKVAVTFVRSRFGAVAAANAGALGMLEQYAA